MSAASWRILLRALIITSVGVVIFVGTYFRKYEVASPGGRREVVRDVKANQTGNCFMRTHCLTIWERNSHLRRQCSLLNQSKGPATKIKLYHWKNLNYCKVPKGGSTYWMQIFLALNNVTNLTDLFGKKRSLQHSNTLTTISWSNIAANDVIFHVTRNPYSRLFSAYIDKIFLPGFWQLAIDINKRNGKPCSQPVSFEEFLKFVMVYYLNEPHWQPTSALCSSCTVPYNVISKQETFNQDVHFILDQLNISNSLKQYFFKNLQEKHTENSIKEITKVMAEYAKKASCITFLQFIKRLWKSFQIQGYISDSVPCPLSEFRSLNFYQIDNIVWTCLKATRKIHMTEKMSSEQRQRHLARAFASVSSKTIELIRMTYKSDFEIFGYSYELPTG